MILDLRISYDDRAPEGIESMGDTVIRAIHAASGYKAEWERNGDGWRARM